MNKEADIELICSLQTKDSQANLELFMRYKDRVFFFLKKRLNSEDEAIFVAIEAYIAVIEKIRKPNFDPDRWELLDKLVWGIVKNKMKSYQRQKRRERQRMSPLDFNELNRKAIDKGINEYQRDEELLKLKTMEVLNEMPSHYKQAFYLLYFQGLEVREISEMMDVKPQRIYEYIAYATKKIRLVFKKEGLLFTLLMAIC